MRECDHKSTSFFFVVIA